MARGASRHHAALEQRKDRGPCESAEADQAKNVRPGETGPAENPGDGQRPVKLASRGVDRILPCAGFIGSAEEPSPPTAKTTVDWVSFTSATFGAG